MTNVQKADAAKIKQWFASQVEANSATKEISDLKAKDAIRRGLLFLYDRQTATEKQAGHTSQYNNEGFSGVDAEFLSSVASKVRQYNVPLSNRQAFSVAKCLRRYSAQLLILKTNNQEYVKVAVMDSDPADKTLCQLCGAAKPYGRSCGCSDNDSQ